MLFWLMRTIGLLDLRFHGKYVCFLDKTGHNLDLVAAKVHKWLLVSEAHISSLFIVKLYCNIWMDITNTTMHQFISHKPDQVLWKVTEGKRGTCSNLWIMVAVFLRGVSTCRILRQQLLKYRKSLGQRGFAKREWNIVCKIHLLTNILASITRHTSLMYNWLPCECCFPWHLLQAQ